jgi:L-iditol 2-dehydrogenase
MRAVTLSGAGYDHLAVGEVPVPRPGPRQMLARVDAAGICTSLIKIIEQGSAHSQIHGWDLAKFPLILGDEGAVTLVEVGAGLAGRFATGQRCAVQPAVDHAPVNWLERYREGGAGVAKVAVGYTLPGHLAEYILLTEEAIEAGCVLALPDGAMPAAHAAAAEPLSCCVSAQEHHLHLVQDAPDAPRRALAGLRRGGVTVIIGAGAMGRMHVDVAMTYAPRAVVVADMIPERLELVGRLFGGRARKLGVGLHAVNVRERDLGAFVAELTARRGADDVIVAVGSKSAIEAAQKLCARGAVLDLFGGLKKGEDLVGLDAGIVHYREINVTGSSGGSPWDLRRTLELMAAGQIETAAHITRIGDLGHVPELIGRIRAQELDGKAVVYPHRRAESILAVPRWTADDERAYLAG